MHNENEKHLLDGEVERSRAELALIAALYLKRGEIDKAQEVSKLLEEIEAQQHENPAQLEA